MKRKKTTTIETTDRRPDVYFNGNLDELRKKLTQVASSHNLTSYAEWSGFQNVEKAIHATAYGSPEILEKYLKKANDLNLNNPESSSQIYYKDTQGLFFDIVDVIQGRPEHWFNVYSEKVNQTREIFIDITASHKVEEAAFFKKFQLILNFIDNLEKQGTRCKVNVGAYNAVPSDKNGNLYLNVMVKNYNEPINLQLFSTLLCTPLFLRFALCGLSSEINGEEAGAYRTDPNRDKVGEEGERIYIPSVYYDKANMISYTPKLWEKYNLSHLINNN